MSFSNAERVRIRAYLGYSQTQEQEFYRLESALNLVENDADKLTEARLYLTNLATIDQALLDALDAAGVNGLSNQGIVFGDKNQRLEGIRKQGRMWVARLSNMIGLQVYGGAYSESGFPGDDYLRHGWRTPGGIGGLFGPQF